MEVILLEQIRRLGQMGSVVRVADGYARNFLLPQKKALRVNKQSMVIFEQQRAQLEAENQKRKLEAQEVAEKINGRNFVVIRSAAEMGQLYGSVSTRDISDLINKDGFAITRLSVRLDVPIKTIGQHTVRIDLHPEVEAEVIISVVRSQEEVLGLVNGEEDISVEPSTYADDDASVDHSDEV